MSSTEPSPALGPHPAQRVILVVDDDLATLRMLGDALTAEGYAVLAARDADEALRRLDLSVPDGLLLDAVMPGIDGFTLCERIKATPPWSHIPVVFMTGLSETEQIVRGFAAGGVDYVVKPLRLPEVLARLATHIANARAARLARDAVDVAGMGVVVLDGQDRIAWRSPQATRWLEAAFAADPAPARAMARWLAEAQRQQGEGAVPLLEGQRLSARPLGASGLGETMLLLSVDAAGAQAAGRAPPTPLTPRETEVLSWIAKGKTNRDIAEILGMSPRTVNKHLEHIFEKLGVETRTAAAALAGQLLQD
ncbi:response regulator [Acidovorax sp. Leaf160]|uniref:response regulator transcription factor n=1 Tax=Acidovorax sp. Leaf160 TaxID=1736280 RepID=UPI0006FBCB81|nr:response regulator [Acidovorax sp. Leaf160]KQR61898.1 LuxR family transcriptional regulator [Acidovorax sp. Leaf160]